MTAPDLSDTSLLAAGVRSGVEESYHSGVVAVSGLDGELIASTGDVDRPFFLRSAAKPFQAHVSQESGAGLTPLELAMASASHRGEPVHVALVEKMLDACGLDDSALGCPPDWPLSESARQRLHIGGVGSKRRIWHNCSGKHAGFLRACVAQGWPVGSYLRPDHPLQKRIAEFVSELGEHRVEPVGVDGCGAPALRTTARAMAILFARLGADPALSDVFTAMHRYPALIGNNGEGDSAIATVINGAAKGGAQGCMGVAVYRRLGVAVKSWDGLSRIAAVGAIAALDALGELTPVARMALEGLARPAVMGGGVPVGGTEPRLGLIYA